MDIVQFKSQTKGVDGKSNAEVISYFEEMYTYKGIKPKVRIDDDMVVISIDTNRLERIDKDVAKAMQLCNLQKFAEAIKLFSHVVDICPAYADAWRAMAQAKMMLGNYDEALKDNENALRHDPTNLWALILMGNIYSHKQEYTKALNYYEKVVEYHPDNALALNNIGATYLKLGRWDDGIRVFSKSLQADSSYLNTYYGICLCHMNKNDLRLAFEMAQDGMKYGKVRPENANTFSELQKLMLDVSKAIVETEDFHNELEKEKNILEKEGGRPIKFTKNESLEVYAQMRYAPARRLDYHEVVYNPNKGKLLAHLFMHELMHLEMNIAAAKRGENCFVVTKDNQIDAFRKRYAKSLSELQKQIGETNANAIFDKLMHGVLLQIMNCGLDMLVEKKIYDEHAVLRPMQVVSIYNMITEYAQSVKAVEKDSRFPKEIVAANKIMNIATAMQFKDLYNIDLVPLFNPTPIEKAKAKQIFTEYELYQSEGYNPGDEYDFVSTIAGIFDYEDYFDFIPEHDAKPEDFYRSLQDKINQQLKDHPVAKDSVVVNEINKDFRAEHSGNEAETMMMTMYMLDAMNYFDTLPLSEVHKIAMEIAVVGMGGINPNNKGYKVKSIPGKEFGGYQFLAYYYVSFARAIPHLLPSLQLPFEDAYNAALQLHNAKK